MKAKPGMGSHHKTKGETNVWLSPPKIVDALGPFDLDPCAAVGQPWKTARHAFTIDDNGLLQRWAGRVWLNPPYGPEIGKWMGRLVEHGTGTALTFARTETEWFQDHVFAQAHAILFLRGRLKFFTPDGREAKDNGGAPSCLIAYGSRDASRLFQAAKENLKLLRGEYIELRP